MNHRPVTILAAKNQKLKNSQSHTNSHISITIIHTKARIALEYTAHTRTQSLTENTSYTGLLKIMTHLIE